jgi:hypothetical protein
LSRIVRRRQLVGDRIRTQSRIKAELKLYGIDLPEPDGKWTKIYLGNLGRIRFNNRWMQESFKCLLEQYHFLDGQIVKQTKLLREPTGRSVSSLCRLDTVSVYQC